VSERLDPSLEPERVRAVGRTVAQRIALANIAGALLVFFDLNVLLPGRGGFGHRHELVVSGALFVAYMAITVPLATLKQFRIANRTWGWVSAEQPRGPTPEERDIVLAEPWREAKSSFVYWAGAAALFGTLQVTFHNGWWRVVQVAGAIVLGGLTTSLLSFLLTERSLRPVFAGVLHGQSPERPSTSSIQRRLMITWALCSGIPLLMLGLGPIGLDSHARNLLGGRQWLLALLGLVGGGVVTTAAAKAVSEPLREVRSALRRVQSDDLDIAVTVNDGGEVGLLQSGFNTMVAGLRERRRIRDLFGRHVGVEVASRALEGGDDVLGGHRREASALFVDIVGSTTLAQTRPPDEVVGLLNVFFGMVVRCIEAEDGFVNKFEGDGALCIFGAPIEQGDHAARALRAARTLRRELLALAASYPDLDAAIGVSAGTVVAGNVGAEQRYEYTVIGDPVNEAARLTDSAKRRLGRVLASDDAVQRSGDEAANWAVAEELRLRGRAEATLAYEPRVADVTASVDAGGA
jgi:adenylate cyclase